MALPRFGNGEGGEGGKGGGLVDQSVGSEYAQIHEAEQAAEEIRITNQESGGTSDDYIQ